jgi:hypothetical protein
MAYDAFSDFILDQVYGYQSANKLKNNIEALAAMAITRSLGGSRENSVIGSGDLDPFEYRDAVIDSTKLGDLSCRARVETLTTDAGTSVQPKIWKDPLGTPAVHVAGTAHTGTTWTEELIALTPLVAGSQRYRLKLTTNNGTNPVKGLGVIEIYA